MRALFDGICAYFSQNVPFHFQEEFSENGGEVVAEFLPILAVSFSMEPKPHANSNFLSPQWISDCIRLNFLVATKDYYHQAGSPNLAPAVLVTATDFEKALFPRKASIYDVCLDTAGEWKVVLLE